MNVDFNYKTSVFPIQKLPVSKKDEMWRRACVDSIIGREGGMFINGTSRKETMRTDYNLYNSIFDVDDLKYVTNPWKVEDGFPATPQNFNIIRPKIDLLIGEASKRPFNFKVFQTNEEAASEVQQKKHDLLLQFVLERNTNIGGQQPNEQEDNQKLEEIRQYLDEQYTNNAERLAYHTLKYLMEANNIEHEFIKGFKDALISGEEIFYTGILNGEPVLERVNPLHFTYDQDPEIEFIEDGDWALRRLRMSPANIYDRFYDIMKEEDLDKLLKLIGGDANNVKASDPNFNQIVYRDKMLEDFTNGEYFRGQLINVWHVTWRSFKKVGFLKIVNEDGEPDEVMVDETYKPSLDEQITWDWIVEIWEGYRVGNDVYLGINPLQYQHVDIDNPNSQKLPYTGVRFSNTNSINKSIVDIMKPLQYMYIILWYRLELAIARDKGKVPVMDVTQIPKSMNIDVNKWMHYLSSLGVMFVNPYEEGWDVPGREGGRPAGFNQFTALDLTMSNVIAEYINLLTKIEEMCGEISGITRQRQGQVQSSELVGNVERTIIQSSHITEPIFWLHNQCKKRALINLLNTAKFAWADSGKKKLHYIFGDATRVFMDISEDFLYSDFGVHVSDSTRENAMMEQMKSLLQPAIQNGATLTDAAAILTSDNISEIKKKLKDIETRRESMMQQQQQQEQQMQAQQAQMQQQQAEEDNRIKEEDSIRKSDTAIQVAIINAQAKETSGAGETQKTPENNIPNELDVKKFGLESMATDRELRIKEILAAETLRKNKANEAQKQEEIGIKRIQAKKKPTTSKK
jgi:hypothetical protein